MLKDFFKPIDALAPLHERPAELIESCTEVFTQAVAKLIALWQ